SRGLATSVPAYSHHTSWMVNGLTIDSTILCPRRRAIWCSFIYDRAALMSQNPCGPARLSIIDAVRSAHQCGQGHLVFQCNPDESQRLYRLGSQPTACCRTVRMACPPEQTNRGVA